MNWVTKAEIILEVRMTGAVESRPMRVRCKHFCPLITDQVQKNVAGSMPGQFIQVSTYAAVDLDDLGNSVRSTAKYYRDFLLHGARKSHSGPGEETMCKILANASQYAVRRCYLSWWDPISLMHY